jgi:hypothetical protein
MQPPRKSNVYLDVLRRLCLALFAFFIFMGFALDRVCNCLISFTVRLQTSTKTMHFTLRNSTCNHTPHTQPLLPLEDTHPGDSKMLSKTRCASAGLATSTRHTACVPRPARAPAGRRSSIASRAAQPEEQPTTQAEAAAPAVLRDMQVSWDKFLQVRVPTAGGLRPVHPRHPRPPLLL